MCYLYADHMHENPSLEVGLFWKNDSIFQMLLPRDVIDSILSLVK